MAGGPRPQLISVLFLDLLYHFWVRAGAEAAAAPGRAWGRQAQAQGGGKVEGRGGGGPGPRGAMQAARPPAKAVLATSTPARQEGPGAGKKAWKVGAGPPPGGSSRQKWFGLLSPFVLAPRGSNPRELLPCVMGLPVTLARREPLISVAGCSGQSRRWSCQT